MFLMPIDDPLANSPPDKASVLQKPQQIVPQRFRSVRNHDYGESDVHTRLSGCPINNDLSHLPYNRIHPLPAYEGISTFSTSGSADSEVYNSTPSMLDHSAIVEPLSPSSDLDALGIEGDDTEYKEELLSLDRETATLGFGMQATFAFAASSPYPSPCVSSGYGPPLWQHMDGAATTDAHYPLSHPRYDYPAVGSSPTVTTGESHSVIKIHQEVISHVHMNHGVPWLYDANVGQGRTALLPVCAGINPSLLSMPLHRVANHCSEASLYGQEQLQEHHDYHAAPAGALSLGSGMQRPGYSDGVPPSSSLPTTASGSPSYPNPHLCPTEPRDSTDKAHNNTTLPSKKPATNNKKKRKQSTEKVHDCLWPECSACKFAIYTSLRIMMN